MYITYSTCLELHFVSLFQADQNGIMYKKGTIETPYKMINY